jgi:hypothetical protein
LDQPVHLRDPVRKVQLGVTTTHEGHVAVDDRPELLPRFGLELARLGSFVGD